MKEIKIENIVLYLSDENNSVRVKSMDDNVILCNQDIEVVLQLIEYNFYTVSSHYKSIVNNSKGGVDFGDINRVSIAIVLYYLYTYNQWRNTYKKQENKDLRFNKEDLDHPSTHDVVFRYFKTKYPDDWEKKSSILLEMNIDDLRAYYKTREEFYNR